MRFSLLFIATALCALHAIALKLDDNCKVDLPQGDECGESLACTHLDQPYRRCARARTVGDECESSRDCARGLACGTPDGQCRKAYGAGDTCINDVASCDVTSGLHCQSVSGTLTCVPLKARGEDCFSHPECQVGLICGGACRAEKGPRDGLFVGANCWADPECANGTFLCDGKCIQPLREGEACEINSHCKIGTVCVKGVCVTTPEEGEAFALIEELYTSQQSGATLSTRFNSNCAGSLDCVNSKCVPRSKSKSDPPVPETEKSEKSESGLSGETKIGLAIGIPSMALTAMGVVIGYWQLKRSPSTSPAVSGSAA